MSKLPKEHCTGCEHQSEAQNLGLFDRDAVSTLQQHTEISEHVAQNGSTSKPIDLM